MDVTFAQHKSHNTQDLFVQVVNIRKNVQELYTLIENEHAKTSPNSTSLATYLEKTDDIKLEIESFLRELLMAPLNRKLIICRPGERMNQEEKQAAVLQEIDDLKTHTTQMDS
mgnify:CR=1 FL=1